MYSPSKPTVPIERLKKAQPSSSHTAKQNISNIFMLYDVMCDTNLCDCMVE